MSTATVEKALQEAERLLKAGRTLAVACDLGAERTQLADEDYGQLVERMQERHPELAYQ